MSKIGKDSKEEAYSWRPSRKLLKQLEAITSAEKIGIDALLARIVRDWLAVRAEAAAGGDSTVSRGYAGFDEEADVYGLGAPGTRHRERRKPTALPRQHRVATDADVEQQRQMREAVLRAAGTVSLGLGPYTNRRVREVMGQALEKKYRESQRRAPRRPR